LVGYGLAGSAFHAPLITTIEDFSLDIIVTANPERQQRAQARYPGARIVASADELWRSADELDLVVVASPNRTHVPLATTALRTGLPVVVDKPLCATAAEALALANLADEVGRMLSVYQNRRWDSDFLTLRGLIEAGELGDLWRYESRFERWRSTPSGLWRESGDPAEVGGLLYDLGSHLVDQALVLFGPASSVYAEVLVRRAGAQTDDDSFVALEHASGVRSHLWMNVIAAQPGPRFNVLGSVANFVKYGLDPQEMRLRNGERPGQPGDAGPADGPPRQWGEEPESAWGTLTRPGAASGPTQRVVPSIPGDYPAYYRGVAAALGDAAPPPVTAREAAATTAILEAARESARQKRPVAVAGG
jgi:predicted dehydrogenase